MKFAFLCAILFAFSLSAAADEKSQQTRSTDAPVKTLIKVYGAANPTEILPVFEAFDQLYPGVSVEYTEFSTVELYRYFLEHPTQRPDLLLSPAMDLQIKLVNDGHALAYKSPHTASLPSWAQWRNEIFGFTYEPIVIVLNKAILDVDTPPLSRTQLVNFIRKKSSEIRGKIGLSNIEKVGLGYLTWSHDSQVSRTYGRLLEVFGAHQARFYPHSTAMLQAIAKGEINIAYNVLGSYAQKWADLYPAISVIMPSDYTTVIMRSAFIPKSAKNVQGGKLLLDFLLSKQGQQVLAEQSSLNPINNEVTSDDSIKGMRKSTSSPLRPILFGLELLLQTDNAKRQLLFDEWKSAMSANNF